MELLVIIVLLPVAVVVTYLGVLKVRQYMDELAKNNTVEEDSRRHSVDEDAGTRQSTVMRSVVVCKRCGFKNLSDGQFVQKFCGSCTESLLDSIE